MTCDFTFPPLRVLCLQLADFLYFVEGRPKTLGASVLRLGHRSLFSSNADSSILRHGVDVNGKKSYQFLDKHALIWSSPLGQAQWFVHSIQFFFD